MWSRIWPTLTVMRFCHNRFFYNFAFKEGSWTIHTSNAAPKLPGLWWQVVRIGPHACHGQRHLDHTEAVQDAYQVLLGHLIDRQVLTGNDLPDCAGYSHYTDNECRGIGRWLYSRFLIYYKQIILNTMVFRIALFLENCWIKWFNNENSIYYKDFSY